MVNEKSVCSAENVERMPGKTVTILVGKKKLFLLLAKMKGDPYRLDVAESKYGNWNSLSPTALKGERFKVNNYIFN